MVGMYFVNTYIGFIGPLNGPSMNPTINTEGDIAVVSISKRYNLGDVVVAKDGPSRCKLLKLGVHLAYLSICSVVQENSCY